MNTEDRLEINTLFYYLAYNKWSIIMSYNSGQIEDIS